MTGLINDLRHGLRANLKHWPSSLVIVLILGVGIGATVAMFNIHAAMSWRPLPFNHPESLVALRETPRSRGLYSQAASWPSYLDWRRDSRAFSALGAFQRSRFNVGGGRGEPENLPGARITPSLLPMLGVDPLLGRTPLDEEGRLGRHQVVLLSHSLWESRFNQDPEVVGRTLRIDGAEHDVVGVMPPRFAFPEIAQLWVPLAVEESSARRDARDYDVIARLAEGVGLAEARARMDSLASRIARIHPDTNAAWRVRVSPLKEAWLSPDSAGATELLSGSVFLVLAITCANVALLLLSRFHARTKEAAVRLAIGATRVDLMRRFMFESALLAAAGGLIGIPSCILATHLMVMAYQRGIPYWLSFDVRPSTFVLAAFVTLTAALMAGLLPALRSSRLSLGESLKEETRSATAGRQTGSLKRAFAVIQFAMSFALLACALLTTLSYLKQRRFDHGFDARKILTLRFSLRGDAYQEAGRRLRFNAEIMREAQALPGVERAAISTDLPLGRYDFEVGVVAQDRPVLPGEEDSTQWRAVSSSYLDTFRIPLLSGRTFTTAEEQAGARVALVSDTLARRLWPDETAIGRRLRTTNSPLDEWWEVVGVTGTVRHAYRMEGLRHVADSQFYVPLTSYSGRSYWLSLKSERDWRATPLSAVKDVLARVDRSIPFHEAADMETVVGEAEWLPLFLIRMFVALSLAALALTSLGAYGIVSNAAQQRRQEIGVRMALGARAGEMSRLVLRQALNFAAMGVTAGVLLALVMTPLMRLWLYGISPLHPLVMVAAALIMAVVAVLAAGIPAWRAGRVDPVVALRCE
jgi:putative ABC transport system permease protein